MCESILCFWWLHTRTPLKLLTPTLLWFTFDRLQPCSAHTLHHAVASLIVCYHPWCISIGDNLPPSPPPLFTGEASRHALDVAVPLCATTQRGKGGDPLKCVCCHRGAN